MDSMGDNAWTVPNGSLLHQAFLNQFAHLSGASGMPSMKGFPDHSLNKVLARGEPARTDVRQSKVSPIQGNSAANESSQKVLPTSKQLTAVPEK